MGQPQPPQLDTAAFMSVFIPLMLVFWAFAVIGIIAMWRIFTKAGQRGWAAIVPFYGTYVLLKTVGRPGWWLALLFIPIANIVIIVLVMVDLAKAFGKSGGFAVLLIFLPFIGMLVLAFGDARYVGPVADPNFVAWQNSQQYGYPPQYPPQAGYQQYPQQGYPPQQGPWQ